MQCRDPRAIRCRPNGAAACSLYAQSLSRRERLTNAERRLGEGASVPKHTPHSLFGLRLGYLEFSPRDKTVSMSQLAYTVSDLRAEPIDALKAAGN